MAAILIISPERWTDHFVSKHHYALKLAGQGKTVLFLNPPDDSLGRSHVEKVNGYSRLFTVDGPVIGRGLRFYPGWLRRFLESRWLIRLEQSINQSISTIWLFENSRFFDMAFAGNRLKIYHQVDLNQDFQVETAAKTADICFCTTDYIEEQLLSHNPNTYKIHHGVEISSTIPVLQDHQLERFKSATVHAAYIGNLEMAYMDTDILSNLARKFSKVSFHFVGGFKEDGRLRQSCRQFQNVIWWEKVDSRLIPSILEQVNVLLVVYHESRYKDQASPHKMMEYLASGKTIIATYTDEYKDKRHLLEMVDNASDFPGTFAKVIESLDDYNSPEKQKARIEYAHQHSYDKQLDKIIALLKKHCLDKKLSEG